MNHSTTICCLKQGEKYGAPYVNILYAMVARQMPEPPEFVCFTDDADGVDPRVRCLPLPLAARGWWGKMGLFAPELPGIATPRILYLDLDVVITGPLDGILSTPSDCAMAKDYPAATLRPDDPRQRDANTSVMLLQIGARRRIYDDFLADARAMNDCWSDQDWINRRAAGAFSLFPEALVQSYKLHNLRKERPVGCSVVMFHGEPKPHQCDGWVKDVWTLRHPARNAGGRAPEAGMSPE